MVTLETINEKLDILLEDMQQKKRKQAQSPAQIRPALDAYKKAARKLFTASGQDTDFKSAPEIRTALGAYLKTEVPDSHATWIGRIMGELNFPGGIRKVGGKTVRGFYVTYNS